LLFFDVLALGGLVAAAKQKNDLFTLDGVVSPEAWAKKKRNSNRFRRGFMVSKVTQLNVVKTADNPRRCCVSLTPINYLSKIFVVSISYLQIHCRT